MSRATLEDELVALKQAIIEKILDRHGMRLTRGGERSIGLATSYDLFQPDQAPNDLVKRSRWSQLRKWFRRLSNGLKPRRWIQVNPWSR
jgi:hypothetical protein